MAQKWLIITDFTWRMSDCEELVEVTQDVVWQTLQRVLVFEVVITGIMGQVCPFLKYLRFL